MRTWKGYRCEAVTREGFVKQVAVQYLRHGYWFYVTGWVPEGKEPRAVDTKLMERYGINVPPWSRARRAKGQAAVHYVRFERFFVLLACAGEHRFFELERASIKDMRLFPLRFAGYEVSYRRSGVDASWHSSVSISRPVYLELRRMLVSRCRYMPVEQAQALLHRIPFYPYARVRRQLLALLRHVNAARRLSGRDALSAECLRLRPWACRVFEQR
ncbi:MAG: hypothetical protein AAFU73_15745 [Planctomycetota bacterium]